VSGVRVAAVHKSFGSTAVLRGLDLAVPDGSLVAVLGPSGCGKTTLLRVVAGFERADGGTVTIGDRVVEGPGLHLPPERRRVAVVPQEQALFPHLSVGANVGYGLARSRRRGPRVADMLDLVGLSGYARRMPHQLSGGQQQRVAVARALAPSPSVVLLDEPFSALDANLRASVRGDVRTALRACAATAVLVTHDQAEALSVADLVAVVRAGRVVQTGTPFEVYSRPVDLGVAAFVGDAVVLPGVVEGTLDGRPTVRCGLGRLVLAGDPPSRRAVRVLVRPEQLDVLPPGHGVPAVVRDRTFYGHDGLLALELAGGERVASRGREPLAGPGERVGLRVVAPVVCYPDPEPAPSTGGC
jgi:iron(III) transport system ATP-binding protein